MPSFTMVPPRGDHPTHGHFWVPIDDENNWAWSFDYHPTRDLTPAERTEYNITDAAPTCPQP